MFRIVACSLLLIAAVTTHAAHPLARRLQVRNEGEAAVEIEWINPQTGEIVPFAGSQHGQVLNFDSYVNHTFRFRAVNNNRKSKNEVQYVTVGQEDEEQVFVLKEDLEVERLNAHGLRQRNKDVSAMTEKCRQRATQRLSTGDNVDAVSQDLVKCLEKEAARLIEISNEELAFQRQLRKDVANLGENYTCADPTKETTKPKELTTWTYENQNRTVGILHSRPASQIHILYDFISEEECEAIKEAAAPALHRGTVADGKGGSKMSENRKAWQAGLRVKDWRSTIENETGLLLSICLVGQQRRICAKTR